VEILCKIFIYTNFLTNVDYYLNLEFTSKSDNNLSIKRVVINIKMLIKTLQFKIRKEYLFFFYNKTLFINIKLYFLLF